MLSGEPACVIEPDVSEAIPEALGFSFAILPVPTTSCPVPKAAKDNQIKNAKTGPTIKLLVKSPHHFEEYFLPAGKAPIK